MRKLWLALLFATAGLAHEWRHPTSCVCITSTSGTGPRKRARG